MTCKKDFERYLECKGDEIDNAAYALAVALLRTHPDQTNEEILPWDKPQSKCVYFIIIMVC